MRTFSKFLIAFLGLSALISVASAQQTRVAYIDAEKLLKRMPEVKDADARMEQLKSSWTREATDMQAEIDRKQAEFDRRKLIMTDAERNAADLDLSNLKKKRADFLQSKFNPDGELFTQQATLMKPAYERLMSAIHETAIDGNFDYVFDRSSKDIVLLYSNSKFDLTLPVARRLGIESELISTPLVNNAKPGTPGQPGTPGNQPGQPGQPNPGLTPNTPQTGTNGIPNTAIPNPGTPNTPPAFNNSGSNNPGQQPPPPQKPPATGH